MQKLQIIIILILVFGIKSRLYSQNIILNRNLNWTKSFEEIKKFEKTNENKTQIYHFFRLKNADYSTRKDFLPVYHELIALNSGNYTAELRDMQFVVLTSDEKKMISKSQIPFKIEFEKEIFYLRKAPHLSISVFPFKQNVQNGEIYKLKSFKIVLTEQSRKDKTSKTKSFYTLNSVLSSGHWVKIKIKKSGIYRIGFDELENMGITSPENLRIFGNGGSMLPYSNGDRHPDDLSEIDVLVKDNYILFYGDGTVQWNYDSINHVFNQKLNLYSDYAYYFLSSDYNSGRDNKIKTEQQSSNPTTKTISVFDDFAYHEIDSINLIKSGRLWVGELFDFQTEYDFNFNLPNLVAGSSIKLNSSLLARSPIPSSFTINIAGTVFNPYFDSVSYDYIASYATHKKEAFVTTAPSGNELNVKLTYNKSTASSSGWLDYITLNVQRKLEFTGDQMFFRSINSIGTGEVSEFHLSNTNSNVQIWEITDQGRPKIIEVTPQTNNLTFKLSTDSLRTFTAFNSNSFLTPIFEGDDVGIVKNQNLHGIMQTDMVIVSHPIFLSYAEQLKKIHEEYDQLKISLVSTEEVYNEFSSGARDVSAIRNFLKMLYDRATNQNEIPRYLTLFGDGSYDNKHDSPENTNYILTYQSENSLSPTKSFVTDDFFGLLDDDEGGSSGLVDVGIGRIPVKNQTEASTAIEKIKMYMDIQSYGDWRNQLCFIADDEDGALHMNQANELTRIVKNNYPVFNIEKIYLDAYKQESSSVGQRYPEVNQAINDHITKGSLLINYTGHGNEKGLAEERIITIDQINKWVHPYKLPVFMTATCEFSRFDDYENITGGEHIFLNPKGGAIALFTTTRLVYASPNFFLNKNFYNYIFEKNPVNNRRYCLGDVMRLTKNASSTGINKRNFSLLGDPALKLSYASQNIVTTSINERPVNGQADTLNAFDKVTITGEIHNINGQLNTQFNGILYPSIFDKNKLIKTLDNDGEGNFEYLVQNNKLFKGKASISNGKFNFSFIVPKDIRYNIDTGKICYYAKNEIEGADAKGYNKNILIGGSSGEGSDDQTGPLIQLYLNDESFVSGGITDNSPSLLAFVEDENGINTTGNGIGHDIVAIIDDNPNLQFNLNDFYESEIDSYTKGKINYNLSELTEGEHKLKLKVWDVYNNSTEDSLFFTVTSDSEFKINHVLNYPNPFTTNTSFFFEHNRPNENLTVLIQVFTVTGKIVKSIHQEIITEGYRSEGISWDGKDDFGNRIGRGVYFYKITVQTDNNEQAEHLEKLLIF
ncbi:MAG: type IX secretion system sortase PorU [Bacteroidota bacterium]